MSLRGYHVVGLIGEAGVGSVPPTDQFIRVVQLTYTCIVQSDTKC